MRKCWMLGLVALGLVLVANAWAGPVVPAQLDANTKWFGHVDVEAIRALPIVKTWHEKMIKEERVAKKIQEVTEQLGMNPCEDILGATVYSTQFEGKVGVALIYVKKMDCDKLLAMVKKHHGDPKTAEYAGRKLFSWTCPRTKVEVTGVCLNDKTILVGAGDSQIRSAIDVFDGKKPGLSAGSPLVKDLAPNWLIGARVSEVPESVQKTTKCPVLRVCKAVSVQWSAPDGRLLGQYALTTASPEKATAIKTVIDGFKALGSLQFGDTEAFKKLTAALKYDAEGDTFKATFNASFDDVKVIFEEAAKHHKEMHKKYAEKAKAKAKPKAKP